MIQMERHKYGSPGPKKALRTCVEITLENKEGRNGQRNPCSTDLEYCGILLPLLSVDSAKPLADMGLGISQE